MAFYETREEIAEQLVEVLKTALMSRGLDTQVLVNQYNWINSQSKDPYSFALLMKGMRREEAPTFANVPSRPFAWLIRDNFEQIFEALGLPTTQQAAFQFHKQLRISSKIRSELLGRDQEEALLKADCIVKEFEKISNWCIRAHDILAVMNANAVLLASVTEEEKEFARSLSFDWYYSYSDDAGVRRAGDACRNEVAKRVQGVLATKPYLMKVVEEVARAHRLKSSFFTQPD